MINYWFSNNVTCAKKYEKRIFKKGEGDMKKIVNYLCVPVLMLLLPSNATYAQVATINLTNIKQAIDGFGASTAFDGQITQAQADVAFGNSNGQLGLTILRVRIDPSQAWTNEKANAQKAKAYGAMILATPWTPPASMKTNSNTVGGELLPASYAAYAAHLKAFCDNLGNVDVISLQNEPNIKVSYESCTWNATQFVNFCKNNASSIGKPIMMPETYNFDISYSDPALNDATAVSNIAYIGLHLYGATMKSYTNALNKGKKLWMTEYYLNPDDMGTCLTIGKQILDCMYNNMSAYVWWYLRLGGCNIITSSGSILKKGYTIGQFSKFIRPGYHRVDATYQPQTGVSVVAFNGAQTVVVAVNQNTSSKSQTFTFQNGTVATVAKYTTSSSKSLSNDGNVAVSGNSFTTTLDAQSITTFVGKSSTSIDVNSARLIPFANVINFNSLPAGYVSLELYALNGQRFTIKKVFTRQCDPVTWQQELNDIAPGAYILQMNADNKTYGTMKWSKFAK
jgi:glucuronoarabinoxylan endo-1,4-beta-xylanase